MYPKKVDLVIFQQLINVYLEHERIDLLLDIQVRQTSALLVGNQQVIEELPRLLHSAFWGENRIKI